MGCVGFISSVILTAVLKRGSYYAHFTGEEIEVQLGRAMQRHVTCVNQNSSTFPSGNIKELNLRRY